MIPLSIVFTLARKEKRLLVRKWNKVEDALKIREAIFITPYIYFGFYSKKE